MKISSSLALSVIMVLAIIISGFIIAGVPETAVSADMRYIDTNSENQTSGDQPEDTEVPDTTIPDTPVPETTVPETPPPDEKPPENGAPEGGDSANQTDEVQPDESQPDEDDTSGNETAEEEQAPGNLPPVLSPIGDKTIYVDGMLEFTLSATDPDGDELIYSASGLPSGANFDAAARTFSWTPSVPGVFENIYFEVSDGDLTGSEVITVTVSAAPLPRYWLNVKVAGQGTVSWSPYDVSYVSGTPVQLTAIPKEGWYFSGWSECLAGNANPAVIFMEGNYTVISTFKQKPVVPAPPADGDTDVDVNVRAESEVKVTINLIVPVIQDSKIHQELEVWSPDLHVWLKVPRGTVCLDLNGNSLTLISIEKLKALPGYLPAEGLISAVYNLSPDGATFNPAASVHFKYNPALLPAGAREKDIRIVRWDESAGAWVELNTAIDSVKNTASALITHCSLYSIAMETAPGSPSAVATTVPAVTQAEEAVTPAQSTVETQAPEISVTPEAIPEATSEAAPAAETEEADGSNWGVIILIIAGVLLVGAVVAMVIIYWSKKDVA